MSGYERYNPYEGATVDGLKKCLRKWTESVEQATDEYFEAEKTDPLALIDKVRAIAAEMREAAK